MTLAEKLSWGSTSLILGLGAVFVILILLIIFIHLMHRASLVINRPKETKNRIDQKPTDHTDHIPSEDNEGELLAVIAAAIACMAQREGRKYKIKSYRRVRNSAAAWNMAGRSN